MLDKQWRVGTRVGAVCKVSDDKTKIFLFGYGVLEGYPIHPTAKRPNPLIRLDSGKTVWGCECWWSGEEEIRHSTEGKKVIDVDVDAWREQMRRVDELEHVIGGWQVLEWLFEDYLKSHKQFDSEVTVKQLQEWLLSKERSLSVEVKVNDFELVVERPN